MFLFFTVFLMSYNRILFLEDDTAIALNTQEFLESQGFDVCHVVTIAAARQALVDQEFDILLLDKTLPDGDSAVLCQEIRSRGSTQGVLFLTARNELADKLSGFDVGADDYIVKPFSLKEVLARIQSVQRRFALSKDAGTPAESAVLSCADVEIHTETKQVFRQGKLIKLSKKPYDLLVFLIQHKNTIVPKEEIESQVWNDPYKELWSDVVRSHIQILRNKIDADFEHKLIVTSHSFGYGIFDHQVQ